MNFFVFNAVDDTLLSTLLKNIDKSPSEINISQISISNQQVTKFQEIPIEDCETDIEKKRGRTKERETNKNQQKTKRRKSQKNKKKRLSRKNKGEQPQDSLALENLEISKEFREYKARAKKGRDKSVQTTLECENGEEGASLANHGRSPIAKRLRERPTKRNSYYTSDL